MMQLALFALFAWVPAVIVLFAMLPPRRAVIASFLAGYGYTLYNFYHFFSATNGQIKYGDAIFISPAVRKTVLDAYPDEP